MAVLPLVYAAIEDDLRRVLAHGINIQLGFMVVGVGVGTELAINGVAAHAVSHILYKALLFMALGAVLHRTGTARATELGGLHRSMPWTTLAIMIGTAAMSAPLFCGFVSKGLLLAGIAEQHRTASYMILLLASAAVFCVSGLRVIRDAGFGPDRGHRSIEAPINMRVAMGLVAAVCLFLGSWPTALYRWLPHPVTIDVYSADHVSTGLQLLVFSTLAYFWLLSTHRYPAVAAGSLVDTDWVYRRLAPSLVGAALTALEAPRRMGRQWLQAGADGASAIMRRTLGPYSRLAASGYNTGQTVTWVTALLGVLLIFYYL
jgi:multicomponent Na+:H+ antiporter subunit D